MQDAVWKLPCRIDWSWYAGLLLELRDLVGIRELPPDDFRVEACRFSNPAMTAAVWRFYGRLSEPQRGVLFAGIGARFFVMTRYQRTLAAF